MKGKQIVNQPISDELKEELTLLMEEVAGITGSANYCGLTKEANKLVDYHTSIQAMRFGGQVYDSVLCEAAQNMVLTTNQKIEETRAKKSTPVVKLYDDYGDYYGYAYSANEAKALDTKNDFCPTLGNDSGVDENASSTGE